MSWRLEQWHLQFLQSTKYIFWGTSHASKSDGYPHVRVAIFSPNNDDCGSKRVASGWSQYIQDGSNSTHHTRIVLRDLNSLSFRQHMKSSKENNPSHRVNGCNSLHIFTPCEPDSTIFYEHSTLLRWVAGMLTIRSISIYLWKTNHQIRIFPPTCKADDWYDPLLRHGHYTIHNYSIHSDQHYTCHYYLVQQNTTKQGCLSISPDLQLACACGLTRSAAKSISWWALSHGCVSVLSLFPKESLSAVFILACEIS